MKFDELSNKVIGCAIEVHKFLGPGLLESAYEKCLSRELSQAGISYEVQKVLPVNYKGMLIDCGYRTDIFIENKIIVELKSVEKMIPLYTAQLLTYMKLASVEIGLLMNFNVSQIRYGIKRLVL